MGKKKNALPFDKAGGTVVVQRRLLTSEAYLRLSPYAKSLLHLMQVHWKPDKPIGYGVREAMQRIPCADKTASRAFKELQEAGFIVMIDESLFCSRTHSKTRTWRLTWMPWNRQFPANDWEKSQAEN